MVLSTLLSLLFFTLGVIHFNWVFGGKFGFEKSIPQKADGNKLFLPRKTDSALVGVGLTAFGFFYLIKSQLLEYSLPESIIKYGAWIIPFLFLLRAIGDFRYVGFFKKVRNTDFSKMDDKLFSPLCLLIGIAGLILQI